MAVPLEVRYQCSTQYPYLETGLAQRHADSICCGPGTPPIQVAIDADRGLNRLMPQVLLYHRQWDAGGDHPRGTGMSEIVHARRLPQTCLHRALTPGLPAPVEEFLRANGIARTVGEEEAGRREVDDVQRGWRQTDG